MNYQAMMKVLVSEAVRIATFPFRILPIRKNRILFTGLTGGRNYDYSCNPKYLYEYMRDHFPGQYEYVWAVSDCEKYRFLEEEGVKLIRHFAVSSFPMLLTSKVIVTNGSYAPWFPFRRKQYVINTWHGGGAYKKVENGRPDADWATKKRAEFCAHNIDLFVASCKIQEKEMIQKTFCYKGEVVRAGTPRNDRIVNGDIGDMARKVRSHYHIPEDGKVVLYAPTYRNPSEPVVFDSDLILSCLQSGVCSGLLPEHQNDTGKWYFMCRFHRYQEPDGPIRVKGEHILNVADYPDMQELLCAADVLITDYSSCVWDYGFLNKPCFLYVPDKQEYMKLTGFYVNVNEWPFGQAQTMQQLVDLLCTYNADEQKEAFHQHLERLGSYETGESCKQIAAYICKNCN